MKTVIVLAALVALCYAAPQEGKYGSNTGPRSNTGYVPIVRQTQDVNPDGSYSWSYESGDGTAAQAKGFVKNAGVENGEAVVAEGFYSYLSPEGFPISVAYVADERGFHPKGDHLP